MAAFSLPASASAATSPGIKPGSIFYFFDITFEKIGLLFTFSPEKKAEKALKYADERLAEAGAVTDNAEAVKTAITNYESNIAFAEEESKDVGDKEKAEALLTSIADNTSKHQEVLTDVLAKVPDEAKEAITRAIEASRRGHAEAMQKIAELKGEVEKLKQEVAELKAKDEEREKTIEELNKQKSESSATRQKISTPQTPATPILKIEPAKTTSVVTLLNGAVVEIDASGKILQYIKEAPVNTTILTKPSSNVFIFDFKVTPTPSDGQKNVSTVRIEWKTNVPTESKIFLTDSDGIVRLYTSQTGLSTNHFISVGSFEGVTYGYEIEAIGKNGFAKQSGKFIIQERPTPFPTKIKVYSPPYFLDDPGDFSISVAGSKCEAVWFGVAILDQYGNEMANQDVTMTAPAGSITKTLTEKDFFMKSYLSTGVQGQRFYYNPSTRDTKELLTFTSGNLVVTKTLNIRDVVAPYVNYIRNGIEQTHIIIRKIEQNDGSFIEKWVLASSGQLVDPETMTCIIKSYKILY